MSWHEQLDLDYTRDGERTIALDRHEGPLRVLQRLYPEGDAICHHVLVHPPGGIVGGDVLELDARLERGRVLALQAGILLGEPVRQHDPHRGRYQVGASDPDIA